MAVSGGYQANALMADALGIVLRPAMSRKSKRRQDF
jgi:hypothetical protein